MYVLLCTVLPVCLCLVYVMSSLLARFILSIIHLSSTRLRVGIQRRIHRRANHERSRRWKRRRLPLSLVVRCRTRPRCRPPRLDGTLFLSPHIAKHLRWMNRRLRARSFFRARSHPVKEGCAPFGGLCRSTLISFLGHDRDYLQLPRLLSQF
jgi:hypothetical protein